MNPVSLHDAALSWRKRGFSVFPLKPRSKIPYGLLVPRGFLDASIDPSIISDWWRREPEANIGIVTGGGKFAIDLDNAESVLWFGNICGQHGDVPKTLTVRTARGLHVFFSCQAQVPNSVGKLSIGVDVRGEGGYVVAAPSVHPDGHIYTILRDLPIADAPWWLVDLAMPDKVPPTQRATPSWKSGDTKLQRIPGIISLVANAREGERNQITFWAACRLNEMVRENLITQGLADDLLLQSALRCGLNGMEIIRTAKSAAKRVVA